MGLFATYMNCHWLAELKIISKMANIIIEVMANVYPIPISMFFGSMKNHIP